MLHLRRILALAVVLSIAACSEPATSATADPKAVLAASTAGLTVGNYRFTAVMPGTEIDGAVDFASRSAAWTSTDHSTGRTDYEMRLIGPDQYTRVQRDAASAAGKKKDLRKTAAETDDPDVKADAVAEIREIETGDQRFRHLDLSRIAEQAAARGATFTDPDRTGVTGLLRWVHEATMDGATIRGTLAFTGTPGGSGALEFIADRLVDTMVFTASLDAQGRLSRLELELPASSHPQRSAGRFTLTVDNYGTTSAPERPTATKETPESTYQALGA